MPTHRAPLLFRGSIIPQEFPRLVRSMRVYTQGFCAALCRFGRIYPPMNCYSPRNRHRAVQLGDLRDLGLVGSAQRVGGGRAPWLTKSLTQKPMCTDRQQQRTAFELTAAARPWRREPLFMLRVFGRLPVTDSAARSKGRRPKSLRGGNRGGVCGGSGVGLWGF